MRQVRTSIALGLILQLWPALAPSQEQPSGLFILESELKAICTNTKWIASDSTCRALDALLAPAVKFRREHEGLLLKDERAFVFRALTEFLDALEAGRGLEIGNNAYFVLQPLGRLTRQSVAPEPPLRWDDVLQTYWVRVPTDSGDVEMRVNPTHRVRSEATLSVSDSGAAFVYTYDLRVEAESPQALAMFRVPCAPRTAVRRLFGGDWRRISDWADTDYCTFSSPIVGERRGTVGFTTALLMGVGQAITVGAADVHVWPTSDPTDETIALKPLVDSLSGRSASGLVRRIPIPVPKYERADITNPSTGFAALATELASICDDTSWIQPATCDSLWEPLNGAVAPSDRATLSQAPATVRVVSLSALHSSLRRFAQVLDAQRGVTIAPNAAVVLGTLTTALLSGVR